MDVSNLNVFRRDILQGPNKIRFSTNIFLNYLNYAIIFTISKLKKVKVRDKIKILSHGVQDIFVPLSQTKYFFLRCKHKI